MDPFPKTIELRVNKIRWRKGSRELRDKRLIIGCSPQTKLCTQ